MGMKKQTRVCQVRTNFPIEPFCFTSRFRTAGFRGSAAKKLELTARLGILQMLAHAIPAGYSRCLPCLQAGALAVSCRIRAGSWARSGPYPMLLVACSSRDFPVRDTSLGPFPSLKGYLDIGWYQVVYLMLDIPSI